MSLFNEYGVIKHNSYFDYHIEKTADGIQAALLSDGPDLSISEIMILQRYYSMTVANTFSTYILRRQVEKRKQEHLVKIAHILLLQHGFKETPRNWHPYSKESRAGEVGLTIRGEKRYKKRGYCVDIFAAFSEPKRATALNINCNPFSGKYNFLFIESEQELKYAIQHFA